MRQLQPCTRQHTEPLDDEQPVSRRLFDSFTQDGSASSLRRPTLRRAGRKRASRVLENNTQCRAEADFRLRFGGFRRRKPRESESFLREHVCRCQQNFPIPDDTSCRQGSQIHRLSSRVDRYSCSPLAWLKNCPLHLQASCPRFRDFFVSSETRQCPRKRPQACQTHPVGRVHDEPLSCTGCRRQTAQRFNWLGCSVRGKDHSSRRRLETDSARRCTWKPVFFGGKLLEEFFTVADFQAILSH